MAIGIIKARQSIALSCEPVGDWELMVDDPAIRRAYSNIRARIEETKIFFIIVHSCRMAHYLAPNMACLWTLVEDRNLEKNLQESYQD